MPPPVVAALCYDVDAMDTFSEHPYASFLHTVSKPARYAGGEVGHVRKDWGGVQARVCLAFPDVYDIGMSHLGYKILYKILNDDPRTLAERCYTPWVDMEAELRSRKLPLVSLESARPLCDFDVVGLSLQFELTYTNCLTMLDLGGIPLRSCDRQEGDPLVVAGGPTATHPEPVSAFFDAIVVGDGEKVLTDLALAWVEMKRDGVPRQERLRRITQLDGVYVPSLYSTSVDPDTGFQVVNQPDDPFLPFPIKRAFIGNLSQYPFPDDGPIGGPEAIFDRMSIEIARGCTEGCRFCQAGMIYRPVRERDPKEIVDTVMRAVKKSGFDEVSLTCLSTADYSAISPLIKEVVGKLAPEKVSLGVSSLRAYGLDEDLLDDLGRVRASGLTFAPEAGTQRMRDVVNKNVTEEQLLETAQRVFSRGWSKMKLYFMIGLPTEEDEDVAGIVATGARALAVGHRLQGGRAKVVVSVSTHVPKPHTPFQWCAMDAPDTIERKQRMLESQARASRVDLKTHGVGESVLEGIIARGDRSLCDVIETAYRNGARFDSWAEHLNLDVWKGALAQHGIETGRSLGTIPVTARLPWDHIDVGLVDGFLAKEYRKSLKNRLSPPCGKTIGRFVHYTNKEEAIADKRPLVCYDCGVACDLTGMRNERIEFLEKMGAVHRLPLVSDDSPAVEAAPKPPRKGKRPPPGPDPGGRRYRFRFEKTGPTALLGHLDLIRAIPRIFRRLDLKMAYSGGFHPKPELAFGPALALGVMSLAEYVDVKLFAEINPSALLADMNGGAPDGLRFTAGIELRATDPGITKVIDSADFLFAFARSTLTELGGEQGLLERMASGTGVGAPKIRREMGGLAKWIEVGEYLTSIAKAGDAGIDGADVLARAGIAGDLFTIAASVRITSNGGLRPGEIVDAMTGDSAFPYRAVRTGLFGVLDGRRVDPIDLAMRPAHAPS